MPTQITIELLLVCQNPPPPQHDEQAAEFGLQDKQQQLLAGEQSASAARFVCSVEARVIASDDQLDFAGPWVHGPRGGRFLYLGYRLAGTPDWIRRWKIPLDGIRADQLRAVVGSPGKRLRAAVALENRVTIRPEDDQWVVE